MRTCRAVEILFRILPVRAWKGNVLERHQARCAACRGKLASREEAGAYVIPPEAPAGPDRIWPAVEAGLRTHSEPAGRSPVASSALWKAAGIGAAAGIMVLILLISRPPRPAPAAFTDAAAEDFRLDSAEAWGRPAQALIYQARDSRVTIIWVPSPSNGGSHE
jgi:hypothetical protein